MAPLWHRARPWRGDDPGRVEAIRASFDARCAPGAVRTRLWRRSAGRGGCRWYLATPVRRRSMPGAVAPLWHRSRSTSTWSGCQRFAGAAVAWRRSGPRGGDPGAPFNARCAPGAHRRGLNAAVAPLCRSRRLPVVPGYPRFRRRSSVAPWRRSGTGRGRGVETIRGAWRRSGRRSMLDAHRARSDAAVAPLCRSRRLPVVPGLPRFVGAVAPLWHRAPSNVHMVRWS